MRVRVGLSIACVLAAAAAAPATAAQPSGSAERARHDRVVAHWTADRMKAAVPRDFVRSADGRFSPKARPPGGSGDVTGASWTGGGAVVNRTGKVYFEMGGSGYVCTGTAATDSRSGYSVVMTAAHCAYDETARGAMSGFAQNWLFIPSFDTAPTFTCAQTTHGCWTARALVVHRGYATSGSFNTQATLHDFAFAVVGAGGTNGTTHLDQLVGTYPVVTNNLAVGSRVHSFGYPAAGRYRGKDLTYCAGPIHEDASNGNDTWGLPCNMTGGSSGGPWIAGFTNTGGALSSLNSYGYGNQAVMYGPKFGTLAQNVYNAANSATSNTIVQ